MLVTALSFGTTNVSQTTSQQRYCSLHSKCPMMSLGCTSFKAQRVGDSADTVRFQTKQRAFTKKGEGEGVMGPTNTNHQHFTYQTWAFAVRHQIQKYMQSPKSSMFCVACHMKWKDRKCKDTIHGDTLLVDLDLEAVSGKELILVYFRKNLLMFFPC